MKPGMYAPWMTAFLLGVGVGGIVVFLILAVPK